MPVILPLSSIQAIPSILVITTKATITHLSAILFLPLLLVLGGSFTIALIKGSLTFN
ncbi:MAG: hypothetical protein ACTSUF_06865 [Candidatus Heimdallarchaeaceae archaeon]